MVGFDLDEGADDAEPEMADEESGKEPAESEQAGEEPAVEEEEQSPDEPAFPYRSGYQRPVYVRDETWESWGETKRWEVEKLLHDHGVDDPAGREVDDAAFRILAECPELVAALVLDERGIDHDIDISDLGSLADRLDGE